MGQRKTKGKTIFPCSNEWSLAWNGNLFSPSIHAVLSFKYFSQFCFYCTLFPVLFIQQFKPEWPSEHRQQELLFRLFWGYIMGRGSSAHWIHTDHQPSVHTLILSYSTFPFSPYTLKAILQSQIYLQTCMSLGLVGRGGGGGSGTHVLTGTNLQTPHRQPPRSESNLPAAPLCCPLSFAARPLSDFAVCLIHSSACRTMENESAVYLIYFFSEPTEMQGMPILLT